MQSRTQPITDDRPIVAGMSPGQQDGQEASQRILVTREGWLTKAMSALNDVLFVPIGQAVPTNTRVACGWPSRGEMAKRRRAIGQAWHKRASADGSYEILISPFLDEPVAVLATLGHEMVHISVGFECGHRGPFRRVANVIGLVGPMTATRPCPRFTEAVLPVLEALGPYPHAQLGIVGGLPAPPGGPESTGPRPDKGRMIKAQCPTCGMVIRLASKWIGARSPACPNLECSDHDRLMEIER